MMLLHGRVSLTMMTNTDGHLHTGTTLIVNLLPCMTHTPLLR
jgi:hypothetical protein